MASLKDTIINGALRVIGSLFAGKVQTNTMHVPTSSGGSTYGAGTSGQVLATNGTTVYWKNDSNSDTNVTQTATTTDANYEVLFSATADNTTRTETARKNNNLLFNPSTGLLKATKFSGANAYYGECSTATSINEKTCTIDNFTLTDGVFVFVKFTSTSSTYPTSGVITLNVSGTGEKAIYFPLKGLRNGANYGLNSVLKNNRTHIFCYIENGWMWLTYGDYVNSTYTAIVPGYCNTAAGTAAKVVTSTNYGNLFTGSTIVTRFAIANSASSALTVNVNSTGAKTLYINGTVSSSTNNTLPAGTYNMRYDGTNWHIRTDGYDATIPYESITAKSLVRPFSTTTCNPNYFFTPGAITSAFVISMPSNNNAYTCEGYFEVSNTTFNLSETVTFADGSTSATIQWQGDSIVTAASYEFSVQLVTATKAIGYLNMVVQY